VVLRLGDALGKDRPDLSDLAVFQVRGQGC
jgi:hypothetical protein